MISEDQTPFVASTNENPSVVGALLTLLYPHNLPRLWWGNKHGSWPYRLGVLSGTHLDIVSAGASAWRGAGMMLHSGWFPVTNCVISLWYGWPGLPCSSLCRLPLVSSSSGLASFWTPPVIKCQPASTSRKCSKGHGGPPRRWLCLTAGSGKVWDS